MFWPTRACSKMTGPRDFSFTSSGNQQEQRRQQREERGAAGDVQPSLDRAGDGPAGRSHRKRDGIGRRWLVRVRDRRIGRNVDPNRQPVGDLEIRSAGELLTKPTRESLADTVDIRRADPRQKDADGARPEPPGDVRLALDGRKRVDDCRLWAGLESVSNNGVAALQFEDQQDARPIGTVRALSLPGQDVPEDRFVEHPRPDEPSRSSWRRATARGGAAGAACAPRGSPPPSAGRDVFGAGR